jgi:hypothetical protein
MAGIKGTYYGIPYTSNDPNAITLLTLQATFIKAIVEKATVGESYTVGQRSYVLMRDPQSELQEVNAAIRKATGNRNKTVLPNFNQCGSPNPYGGYPCY